MHRFFPALILLAACTEAPPPEDAPLPREPAPVDLAFCEGAALAGSV